MLKTLITSCNTSKLKIGFLATKYIPQPLSTLHDESRSVKHPTFIKLTKPSRHLRNDGQKQDFGSRNMQCRIVCSRSDNKTKQKKERKKRTREMITSRVDVKSIKTWTTHNPNTFARITWRMQENHMIYGFQEMRVVEKK